MQSSRGHKKRDALFISKPTKEAWYGINAQSALYGIAALPRMESAAGLAYHRRAKRGVYHQGRLAALVSHHAPACILLRLDDIQHFVLMICNSFGIDDIHAFGVIGTRDCEKFLNYLAKYDIILSKGVIVWLKITC